jgi:protein gp37
MKTTNIEWTDMQWNPAVGCNKVSEGCKFCYMYRDAAKYGFDAAAVRRTKDKTFYKPLKHQEPHKIFLASWTDIFHPGLDGFRDEIWEIIRQTPQHTFQVLTKRPERIQICLPEDWGEKGYPNVWLGTSIESKAYEGRIRYLTEIKSEVAEFKIWASVEPLLEDIEFSPGSGFGQLDWIVIGGESGNNVGKYLYRECKIEWILKIIRQCKEHQVPFFMKQLGTHLARHYRLKSRHGRDLQEWPYEVLKNRAFPQTSKILLNEG